MSAKKQNRSSIGWRTMMVLVVIAALAMTGIILGAMKLTGFLSMITMCGSYTLGLIFLATVVMSNLLSSQRRLDENGANEIR